MQVAAGEQLSLSFLTEVGNRAEVFQLVWVKGSFFSGQVLQQLFFIIFIISYLP